MAREIKFRGKSVLSGVWVYGYFQRNDVNGNCYITTQSIVGGAHPHHVAPETVGEYTGLKDKNGKEIYEGDVIKHHEDILSEVFYNSIMCAYVLKDLTGNRNKCQADRLGEYSSLWIEVIGNVYENPGALEEVIP